MNLQNNSSDHSNNYLKVLVKRGSSVESIHRAHASICDTKGRTLMKAGSCEYETFIRSALKPFQALPFLTSGASEKYNLDNKTLDSRPKSVQIAEFSRGSKPSPSEDESCPR